MRLPQAEGISHAGEESLKPRERRQFRPSGAAAA
jgi:hypothetical protein